MKVIIDILSGAGTVVGGGEHSSGEEVTLTAKPVLPNRFKSFSTGGQEVDENPFSFTAGDDDVTVGVSFYTTIEDYLINQVGFPVTDGALNNIRIRRSIPYGADVSSLPERTLDLAYADVLMWGANSPTTVTGAKDSDGGWSHQDESRTMAITDKRLMRSTAMDIYKKWGDEMYSSTLKFATLTGKPYRNG